MITNLFSIFDPATPIFISINWLSIIFLVFIPLLTYYVIPNLYHFIFKNLNSILFNEFKPILKKTPFFLIFFCSFFIFIITNNFFRNLPSIFPRTSHMSLTAGLSLIAWLTSVIFGWSKNINNILIHLIPKGAPTLLIPFIVIIETISILIRPLTLALRLSANIIAGHLLLAIVAEAYLNSNLYLQPFVSLFLNPLMLLELAVAIIQGYVFTVLVCLYTEECNS